MTTNSLNLISNAKYMSLHKWGDANNIPFQNCLKLAKKYQVALGRFGSSYVVDFDELNRALEKEIQHQFVQKQILSEKLKTKNEQRKLYQEQYMKNLTNGTLRSSNMGDMLLDNDL